MHKENALTRAATLIGASNPITHKLGYAVIITRPLPSVKKGYRELVAENPIIIKPFTDAEITDLVNTRAEELTYEKTFDFFYELIEADKEDMKDGSPLDKMLWLTRHAYLSGFEQGIRIYNEMINIATGLNTEGKKE